jgi:prepilin-type N-terminal cleavage/methylation domain-containing protein
MNQQRAPDRRTKGITLSLSKGFTLLELLIVIGLIGILVTIAAVAYSSAQKKSRDSRRTSDIKALQAASEQYSANNNGTYPTTTNDLLPYFPGGIPTDPKNVDSYVYTITFPASDEYCHCALLENTSGNSSTATCPYGTDTPKMYYCVSQLQ